MPSAAWVSRARRCKRRASRGSRTSDSEATALVVGKGSRNDKPLDLAGAFEQRVDLGGAVLLLEKEVHDIAVNAADLDRRLGGLDRNLSSLPLWHRYFRPVILSRRLCLS